ncbi:LacI family DNA-binding transcriptional regulator [Psychromarinibacter sp. S121]|uniref:LacI family DNA-binding transcriptional regulator n=1 Tax=Psychromarinibacter sp. S121 TaxID=3415127 RepID=UPI003C79C0D4
MRRMTMADLARLAGVSAASVSLALRGSEKISPATRKRIADLAAEHGYVYNRAAAHLRMSQSTMIAMCLHTIVNPTVSAILTSAQRVLADENWSMMIGDSEDDVAKQQRFLSSAIETNIAGLVLSPAAGTTQEHLRMVQDRIPLVLASRSVVDADIDTVRIDFPTGVRLAMTHLAELGHRRIGWIGRSAETGTRPEGHVHYVRIMAELGMTPPPEWTEFCHPDRESGYLAMKRMLAAVPDLTAVLCFSDLLAVGAQRAAHEVGRAPGRDLSIVGFDDIDEARFATPPLTTVHIDYDALGAAAVRLLLARIDDPDAPRQVVDMAPKLLVRESTCPTT